MSVQRKCSYCHKWYNSEEEHNCPEKIAYTQKHNRNKQRIYVEENKNTEGYKLLHSRDRQKFRKRIISADHGYCQRCKIKFNRYMYDNLEVHHIIPRVDRPDLVFEVNNVVTLCKTCNDTMGLNGIDFNWNPNIRGEVYRNSL